MKHVNLIFFERACRFRSGESRSNSAFGLARTILVALAALSCLSHPRPAYAVDSFFTDNVGIGITAPLASLHIATTTPSKPALFVDKATGRVGIGTTGPGNLLSIQGPSNTNPLAVVDGSGNVRLVLGTGSDGAGLMAFYNSSGDNVVSFTAGGKSYFNTGGNVGIGTTTPAGRLEVAGTASGRPSLYVTSTGNVGIGTTDPGTYSLYVAGDTYIGGVTVTGGTLSFGGDLNMQGHKVVNTSNVGIGTSLPGDAALAVLAGNVGIGTTSPTAKLQVISGIDPIFYFGSSTSSGLYGKDNYLRSSAAGTMYFDHNTVGQDFNFRTSYSSALDTTPLVLKASGYVGIGTTAPGALLDIRNTVTTTYDPAVVNTSGNFLLTLYNTSSAAQRNTGLRLLQGAAGETYINAVQDIDGRAALAFGTRNASDSYAERVRITAAGNLGIGTTGPARNLAVYSASSPTIQVVNSTTGSTAADGGYIQMNSSNLLVGNQESGDINFFVDNGAKNLWLKSTTGNFLVEGNVGIGTTSPSAKLHLYDTSNQIETIIQSATSNKYTLLSMGNTTSIMYLGTNGASGGSLVDITNISDNASYFGSRTNHSTQLISNNSVRMTIDNTGNVGIGTTNPGNYKLNVNGPAFIGGLLVANGGLDNLTTLTVTGNTYLATTSGNVGIGTASPGATLDVISAANDPIFRFGNSTSSALYGKANYLRSSAAGTMYFDHATVGQDFNFRTSSASALDTTALAIKATGNVGIGTINPGTAKLSVNGKVGIGVTSPNAYLDIASGYGETPGASQAIGINNLFGIRNGNSGESLFIDRVSGGWATPAMTIARTNGNVGIGTTAPVYTLDVNGTANISGIFNAGTLSASSLTVTGPAYLATTSGNVGIGTASPVFKLDVNGNVNVGSGSLYLAGANTRMYLGSSDHVFNPGASAALLFGETTDTGYSQFRSTGGLSVLGRLVVEGTGNTTFAGNVGIGTASPGEQLVVYEGTDGATWAGRGVFSGLSNAAIIGSYGGVAIVGAHNAALNAWRDLYINTTSGSDGGNVIMKGNVGIGTTGPLERLSVSIPSTVSTTNQRMITLDAGASAQDASLGLVVDSDSRVGLTFSTEYGQGSWSERMRINNLGNVGIGTTNPGNYKLNVNGPVYIGGVTVTNGSLTFGGNLDMQNNQILNASKISIGTASAGEPLELVGNFHLSDGATIYGAGALYLRSGSGGILHLGSNNVNSQMVINSGNVGVGTASPGAKLHVLTTGVATAIDEVSDFAGNIIGLSGLASNSDQTGVFMGADGGVSAGIGMGREAAGWNSFLAFYTNNVTSGPQGVDAIQEKVRITSAGNVGIGTTSPNTKLEISDASPRMQLTNSSDSNYQAALQANYDASHQLSLTSTNNVEILGEWGNNVKLSSRGTGDLIFQPSGVQQVVFKQGGNVGIGTTGPLERLSVSIPSTVSTTNQRMITLDAGASAQDASLGLVVDSDSRVGLTFSTEYGQGSWSERMRINNLGNVGIGTTNPGNYKLNVNGPAFIGGLLVANGGLDNLTTLTVTGNTYLATTSGNVGIGTASPVYKLEVDGGHMLLGSGAYPHLVFRDTAFWLGVKTASPFGLTDPFVFNTPASRSFVFSGGAAPTDTGVSGGTALMTILGTGNVGIGTASPNAALEIYRATNPTMYLTDGVLGATYGGVIRGYGVTASGGRLQLGTLDASTFYPAITITAQGALVGIGTTAPQSPLSFGSIVNNNPLFIRADVGGIGMDVASAGVRIVGDYSYSGHPLADVGYYTTGTPAHANWVSRFIVKNSGNVGIGMTGPDTKLTIALPSAANADDGIKFFRGQNNYDTFKIGMKSNASTLYRGAISYNYNFGAENEIMTFDLPTGNVGIGATVPVAKLDVSGDVRISGQIYGTGAASTYSAVSVNGAKGGWGGINFRTGTTNLGTLMVSTDNQGFYNDADGGWDWYWTNGTLTVGSVPFTLVSSFTGDTTDDSWTGTGDIYETTGNVGIGVAPASNEKLVVDFADNNWGLHFKRGATDLGGLHANTGTLSLETGSAGKLYINGNVGIGTASPDAKLTVSGGGVHILGEDSLSAGYGAMYLSYNSAINRIYYGDGSGYSLRFAKRTGSATTDMVTIQDGGNVGIGTAIPVGLLEVGDTAGIGTPAFIVKSSTGNVGIGTTAPGAKLDVLGGGLRVRNDVDGETVLTVQNSSAGTSAYTLGQITNGTATLHLFQLGTGFTSTGKYLQNGSLINASGAGGLTFSAANASGNIMFWDETAERMRIQNGGNVGIGTTNPGNYKLNVNGPAYIGGLLVANGGLDNLTTLTVTGNTYLATTSGNVGIGTASPGATLDVISAANDPIFRFGNSTSSALYGKANYLRSSAAGAMYFDHATVGQDFIFRTSYSSSLDTSPLVMKASGNVGIGTAIPVGLLEVGDTTGIGTPAFIVKSSTGSVGIGTTSPGAKLAVNGPETNIVQIRDSTNNVGVFAQGYSGYMQILGHNGTTYNALSISTSNSPAIYIPSNSGNVGIGTASPVALLHTSLAASGHAPMLYSANLWPQFPRTLQNVSASITTNDTTVATGPVIGINLENSSTTDNTYSPLITFSRHSASGGYNTTFASIGGIATGSGGDTNWISGDLVFGTTNSVGPVERMRIKSDGNVGIGTASPVYTLDVNGTLRATSITGTGWSTGTNKVYTTATGDNVGIGTASPVNPLHVVGGAVGYSTVKVEAAIYPMIDFISQSSDANNRNWRLAGVYNSYGKLQFLSSTAAGGAPTTDRLTIQGSDGNVGIGVHSPVQKLDVNGTVRVGDGVVYLAGANTREYVGSSSHVINPGASAALLFGETTDTGYSQFRSTGGLSVLGNLTVSGTGNTTFAGNVGIGTASPTANLHIEKVGSTPMLQMYSNRAADSSTMENRILFGGSTNTGWTTANGAGIDFHVNYPTEGTNGQLRFWTYPLTTGANPAMTINGGNIGIGTTGPMGKFHIADVNRPIASGYYSSNFFLYTTDSGAIDKGGMMSLGGNIDASGNTTAFATVAGRKENGTSGNTAGYLQFGTFVPNVGVEEKMRIQSNGNVGIGTTAPVQMLHVYSTTSADGIEVDGTSNPRITMANAGTQKADIGLATNAGGYQADAAANDLVLRVLDSTHRILFGYGAGVSTMAIINGRVGIGTSAPAYNLQLTGSAGKPGVFWTDTSDRRIKKNIEDFKDGLGVLMKLKPRIFQYNGLGEPGYEDDGKTHIGFVAQEIEPFTPYMVETRKGFIAGKEVNDLKVFQAQGLPFILVNAVQEQQNEIDGLKQEIAELKKLVKK